MLIKVSDLFNSINQLAVRDNSTFSLPCIHCSNTEIAPSQNDFRQTHRAGAPGRKRPVLTRCMRIRRRDDDLSCEQHQAFPLPARLENDLLVRPGEGLLPAAPQFPPLATPWSEAIGAAVQLWSTGTQALAGIIQEAPPLTALDGAVTQFIHQLLPWNAAAAARSATRLTTTTAAAPGSAGYRIHQRGDDRRRFYQQINEFLLRIDGQADEPLQALLVKNLQQQDVIFIWPDQLDNPRAERAHEEEMRWRSLMHELELRDKTVSAAGIGARIIAWADERSEKGFTLFRKGIASYNPFCFLASGGEAILSAFARTVGEIYGGTLLDRLPGESNSDRMQRLMLNLLMPHEQAAAKAFAIRPVNALFTRGMKPVKQLPGTVITHPPSGITLHSLLQSEIAGQQWQLYPLGAEGATAVKTGAGPAVRRAASQSQHNLWRVNGVEGEHRFMHGTSSQWFIQSGEGYYPATYSADSGIAELADGQQVYFHQPSQQWKRFSPVNSHLESRVLALLPEGVSSTEFGPHSVLVSVGHQRGEVWSAAHNGVDYLKVIEPEVENAAMKHDYVAGRLEGNYFSLRPETSQPVYRQQVLKWHAEKNRWEIADSPFYLLQAAEQHIDLNWLQQILAPQGNLVAVHHRPGLYRFGKDYFLRWQTDAAGVEWYLQLIPTTDTLSWRTPQAGAEYEIHFRYNEKRNRWQFLPFTSEAFSLLPQTVKVQQAPSFAAMPPLAEYRHLFFADDDIWIRIGADSTGAADYIRVEQDAEDHNLFSLRVPGDEGQPDSLWRFRYDEDDEFVLEDRRQCLPRVKRGDDDERCAGPSGVTKQSLSDAILPQEKKPRRVQPKDDRAQRWLDEQFRLPEELLRDSDNRSTKSRKNLSFALRLYMMSPNEVSLHRIAYFANITAQRLSAILGQLSAEACHILTGNPPLSGESEVGYAIRLYQLFDGFTPRIIADFTGVSEPRIIKTLRQQPLDERAWFGQNPRYRAESNLEYAMRLYRLPEGGLRLNSIATHTGVDETLLRESLAGEINEGQQWLASYPRQSDESEMDYALRLYHLPHKKVSIEMIALRAGVRKIQLLQRLGQKWRGRLQLGKEKEWLNHNPRHQWESNFDYALRLSRLRDEQVATGNLHKKEIRNNIIAMHANLTPRTFASRLHKVKTTRQWCNNNPRLAEEQLSGVQDIERIMEKNKHYALRLVKLRNQPPKKDVKNSEIAAHVGVGETQLEKWIHMEKREWFSSIPRLPDEIAFDSTDELAIQRINQHYARRLARRRDEEQMSWLISDQYIASHAEVTLRTFRQLEDPLFDIDSPPAAVPLEEESGWQPESGLLHLQLKQNPPLLTDPKAPDRSVTRDVITGPITISNMNDILKTLPKARHQEVAARLLEKAQELVDSDGGRQDYFYDEQGNKQPGLLSQKMEIYHDEQMAQLGLQIIAKEDIEAYELLGVYTGTWHKDAVSLREECRKMGSQAVHTYLWGVYDGDESVSAYQNANKLALINTAQLVEHAPAAAKKRNNLGALFINGLLPGYYSTRKIIKDEPLLISYGSYFLADYMIQSALSHDVVRIIAGKRKCWFLIQGMGSQNSAIFSPDGLVTALPENVNPYILRERLDAHGVLRYDSVQKKGGRRIAVSPDDENNLFHAMAKAIYPQKGRDIIYQEMALMKNSVNEEYAAEEQVIKPEPAQGAGEA